MIVPLQDHSTEDDAPVATDELLRARRLVGSVLLPARAAAPAVPPIPVWQAWLVAGWMVFVTIAYATRMAGLW